MTIDLADVMERIRRGRPSSLPARLWPYHCEAGQDALSTADRLTLLVVDQPVSALELHEIYLIVEHHGCTLHALLAAPILISRVLDQSI